MKTFFRGLLIAIACFQLSAGLVRGEDLSNASILEMNQLGFSEGLIIEKIEASQCSFDLSIKALKELKSANIPEGVMKAMFAAKNKALSEKPGLQQGGNPSEPKQPRNLPEYFGLYAITEKALISIKPGGPTVEIKGSAEFIYYSKTVASAEMFGLFALPKTPAPSIRDGQFKGWQDFVNQSQEFGAEVQAKLEGLPRGSVQIELRGKSVPGQPEMIQLSPAVPLSRGEYQLGIRFLGSFPYRFRLVGSGPVSESLFPEQRDGGTYGTPVNKRVVEPVTSGSEVTTIAPEVLRNPAWPIIEKAINAQGGISRILQSSPLRTIIQGRMKGESDWLNVVVKFYSKYPNKLRQEATFQLPSGRLEQIFNYDSGTVHALSNGKRHTLNDATKENLRKEVWYQNIETLRPILENKVRFKLLEDIFIDGRAFRPIRVTEDQFDTTLLFDVETSLLSRRRNEAINARRKKVSRELVYSDFQEFNGTLIPTKLLSYENGQLDSDMHVKEVLFFEDFPDTYFANPELRVLIN